MAQVSLSIGGFSYPIACRDGEEDHLHALAALVDAKIAEGRSAVGQAGETRQLLLAALLLADEVSEAQERARTVATGPTKGMLEALATRLESVAAKLEERG